MLSLKTKKILKLTQKIQAVVNQPSGRVVAMGKTLVPVRPTVQKPPAHPIIPNTVEVDLASNCLLV